MNLFTRLGAFALVIVYTVSLAVLPVSAQSVTSTFVLSPRTKTVVKDATFDVTINITATATKEISFARAVMVFDPTMLEIPQALEAGSMFCEYPTDEFNYIADNSQGQVMITGRASGEVTCPYPAVNTSGTLFARITFKAKKAGVVDLSFLSNGQLVDDMSAIADTSSPSLYIMSDPSDGKYTILSSATATTPVPPGNLGVDPRIVLAAAVAVGGLGWYLYPRKRNHSRVVTSTEAW
jgi:hypothetical protein